MTITELVEEAHDNSKAHGFWESEPNIGEKLALIHSEVSEALEELREDEPNLYSRNSTTGKPEGVLAELADVMIRAADLAAFFEMEPGEFERIVKAKMEYNRSRPFKHGKKF
jgi:NTP pyrophosphatase (non-canonical NTP hydrolase)